MYPLKTRFVTADFSDLSVPIHYSLWLNGRSRSGIPLPLFQFSFLKCQRQNSFFQIFMYQSMYSSLKCVSDWSRFGTPSPFFPIFTVWRHRTKFVLAWSTPPPLSRKFYIGLCIYIFCFICITNELNSYSADQLCKRHTFQLFSQILAAGL